ncbi:HlyC/CorC family transporter [Candidatus Woesearchaeota archaeon]|nr:HlyC/CorC family transporter [Candidatus Woesearchaeota archaeon]
MIQVWQIIVLVILLFLSGFFSGAEVALVSLSRHKIRKLVVQKYAGARYVKKLKDNSQRMLSTILLGNNVVNIAAAALTTTMAIDLFGHYAVGIATGVMTFLVLVFGEIAPKSIAAAHNELVSRIVAPPIWYLGIIASPLLAVVEFMVNVIPKMLGINLNYKKMTDDDIRHLVKLAKEEGVILDSEEKLLTNVLMFDDKKVKAIATPRKRIISIDSQLNIAAAIKVFAKTKFSRLPVYDGEKKQFIGVVYAKELIENLNVEGASNSSIQSIMRPPLFTSGNMSLTGVFQLFKEKHNQIALVINEAGHVSGMVTLEDLLEEIVGEIHDETETLSRKIVRLSETKYIVDGDVELEKVNTLLESRFRMDGCNNISDYLVAHLKRVPMIGEKIIVKGVGIRVLEVDEHRIEKLIMTKKDLFTLKAQPQTDSSHKKD